MIQLEDSVTVAFFRQSVPGSYTVHTSKVSRMLLPCIWLPLSAKWYSFMDEATGKLEVVKEIIPTSDRDLLRFNDGGVDARGRFWLAEIDKKAV